MAEFFEAIAWLCVILIAILFWPITLVCFVIFLILRTFRIV